MKKINLLFAAIILSSLLGIDPYSKTFNNEATIPSTIEETSSDCMPLDNAPLTLVNQLYAFFKWFFKNFIITV